MLRQRTLRRPVRATGVGLHTGVRVSLGLLPAPPDTGIIFRRTDLDPAVAIPALAEHVADTTLSTSLLCGGCRVSTVEHLMAALAGLGVDNATVELSAGEVPIMDGSAAPLVGLIRRAGILEQAAPKRFLRIRRPLVVEDGDRRAGFYPCADRCGCRIVFSIEFDHPVLRARPSALDLALSTASFVSRISRARTFGFLRDIEQLRARGLARGGSIDNTIVLDEERVLNPGGLRYRDEFVRHKALDAIGDLYQLGHGLLGEFRAHKSGHGLNNAAVRALLAQPDAWELVTLEDPPPPQARRPPGALAA